MSMLHLAGGLRLDLQSKNKPMLLGAQVIEPALPAIDFATLPQTGGYRRFHHRELQQQQNACLGHAVSSAIEKAYWIQTKGQTKQFSREFAYLMSQRFDAIEGDQGASMLGGVKAARDYGAPSEQAYPYTGQYPQGGYRSIPQAVLDEAKKTTLKSWRVLRSAMEVLQWMFGHFGGVIHGIEVNEDFKPDAKFEMHTYRPGPFQGETNPSGHALSLLDWDRARADKNGMPAIWMANWWPDSWGGDDLGGAWVAWSIVDWWCKNAEVIGLSDMEGVTPTTPLQPRDSRWATGFAS